MTHHSPVKRCEQCNRMMVTARSNARFCSGRCRSRWHNRARKRLEGASEPQRQRRRPSREGQGVRIYILPSDSRDRIVSKAKAALDRKTR